ncbi:MAG: glycosyltransferase family 2 protein [Chitinophagales bacterium]|jgi:teichuronic acid biosynthesis glycosyltransferase TuaG|nr:glycosyltransferase [Chitinophagales bacterium]|tara:strand:- start:10229 stop:10996 length:768 start_codon:yes stop_codon:yes gene_type:complete
MNDVNMKIDVSIITPSYNTSKFIEATIKSVLDQDFESWEMVIVDDNSSDRSPEIIKRYAAEDSRIILIENKENAGAAISRNLAIQQSKGRFIAFLDSDDLWLPNKLSMQVNFMLENNFGFTYSAYDKINESDERIGQIQVPSKVSYNDLLKTCSIGCLTAIYDTTVLGKVYMPIIDKRQDYGLWLNLLKKVRYAYGIQEVLAIYRVRNNSISSNKFIAAKYQWKIYREIEELSLLSSIKYMMSYTLYGILKSYFK